MSTNESRLQTSTDVVPISLRHDLTIVCRVLRACHERLDEVATPTTYPTAERIARKTCLPPQTVGHVLTALAEHRGGLVAQLGFEPTIDVAIHTPTGNNAARYHLRREVA